VETAVLGEKMKPISIEKIDDSHYQVTIHYTPVTTHIVTVTADYAQKLTTGKVNVETLLEKSFEFLLEREPNTSILRSFELSVINRYFPEYEREIVHKLGV
jgi:hypothetical protein